MKKRELIEKLASLDDEAEIVLAIITPKEESGFDIGSEGGEATASDEDEDDDSTIDNGDGTITNLEAIDDIDILENEDPENNNATEKFGAIIIDMCDEEDDDDDDSSEDGVNED